MSVLGEIKRRKIFQVAAVYAVVAWLLVQIVATIEAPLNLPAWFDTAIIVLLGIGFPITLIVSWAFNVTPDGLVRDTNEGTAAGSGRGIEYALIALLGVAVLWLLYRDLSDGGEAMVDAAGGAPPVQTQTTIDAGGGPPARTQTTAAADVADEDADELPNSLAVLLCDNFSTDPENAFFAASLHEEMLNQLVKLRNMNVIARTSVLQYSGVERPPITEIADELRVGAVIECSVAYGDGRIVISVQLIDGDTGVHIWSERYNREFADVFGIQADIAMNVANALAVEFSVEEQRAIERAPTDSPEAYALYLQALSITTLDNPQALALLEQALEFDPEFASAHALKANLHSTNLINTTGANASRVAERERQVELSRFHAMRAAEIDASWAWLPGSVINFSTWRWSEVMRVIDKAPDPLAQGNIWLHSYVGEHETAIARARRWFELDPKNWASGWTLAVALAYAGDLAEAARLHREALELAPTVPVIRSWLGFIEIARGNPDAAAMQLERAEQLLGQNRTTVFLPELAYSYSRIGRQADADRIVAEIEQAGDDVQVGTGGWSMAYLASGDRARAIEQLEAAIEKIENHGIDEGFFNLMNIRMNVTNDPVLEEAPFVELRERLRGD